MFILIIVMVSGTGVGSSITAEFSTKEKCMAAAKEIVPKINRSYTSVVSSTCSPK
jgi:hypothetical protein